MCLCAKSYLNIVNIDKYNTILGMPSMSRHKISLDFNRREIIFVGKLHMPSFSDGEGDATAKPSHLKRKVK